MILLAGVPSEGPLAAVAEQLMLLDQDTLVFDQRDWRCAEVALRSNGSGDAHWRLAIGDQEYGGDRIAGAYARLMDPHVLPDVEDLPAGDPARARCSALHQLLVQFIDQLPGRVMNRTAAMATNGSKPLQSRLVESYGFRIPPTLITNEPRLAREFHARHGRVIFKSISGQRSIVTELDTAWIERLDAIRACPVQFQALVPGTDIRVHVVGRQAFATAVAASATDYRYAARQGASAPVMQATTLDGALHQRCVALASGLGLELAGIDLRLDRDGGATCFEVNPCPAFTYYEQATGQQIARAIAQRMVSEIRGSL